jgi:hypothetical protein
MSRKIFIALFLLIPILTLNAQNQSENKANRKIIEKDSLDGKLNYLIDLNEDLNSRDVSFSKEYTKWRKGKIYTLTKDTMIGEIKNSTYMDGFASIVVFYRKNEKSRKTKYRADKVLGYSSNDREYFTKKFSGYPPLFIEKLEEGRINLYFVKFYQVTGMNSFGGLSSREKTYFYIERTDSIQNELSGPVPIKSKNFKEFIQNYISDNPYLCSKVQNDVYDEKHLREIIQIYNEKGDSN